MESSNGVLLRPWVSLTTVVVVATVEGKPVIIGLVEIAKQTGFPKRYTPLLALALGIAAGVFYVSPDDLATGILSGIVMGLASVGLYSGPKNVAKGKVKTNDLESFH